MSEMKATRAAYGEAIAEFGSKTFSATGTKTNILFLEKISPSEKFKIFEDTANIIFSQNFSDEWNDEKIFSAWIFKNKIEKIFYEKFINREIDFFGWKNDAYFGEYFTKFVAVTRSARDFLEKYGERLFVTIKVILRKKNKSAGLEKLLLFCADFFIDKTYIYNFRIKIF